MVPVKFNEANKVLTGPEGELDQNILPLPVFNNGSVSISCWAPTPEELEEINKTGVIWFAVTAGATAPPVLPMGFSPFVHSKYQSRSFFYFSEKKKAGLWIFNSLEHPIPLFIDVDKIQYQLTDRPAHYEPVRSLGVGDWYFREATGEEQAMLSAQFGELRSLAHPTNILSMKLRAGMENIYALQLSYFANETKEENNETV